MVILPEQESKASPEYKCYQMTPVISTLGSSSSSRKRREVRILVILEGPKYLVSISTVK